MQKRSEAAHRRKKRNHAYVLALLAIILIGLAISFAIYSGPDTVYDDAVYMGLAHSYATGTYSFHNDIFSYGYLFTAMLYVSGSVFGYGNASAIFVPVASYMALVVLTYLAGSETGGRRLGLIAAFLVATAPIVDANVTRVLPDITVGAFVACSAWLLVRSFRTRSPISFFWAGTAAALSLYIKMEGLIFVLCVFVICALAVFYGQKIRKRKAGRKLWIAPAYGIAAIFIFTLIYLFTFYMATGSLLYPLQTYSTTQSVAKVGYSLLLLPFEAINPIMFVNIGWTDYYMYPFGLFSLLFVLGCILLVKENNKPARYLAAIGAVCFLFMFYGTVSLEHYTIFGTLPRFFIDFIAPMAVVGAYFADRIISKASGNRSSVMAIAIVALFAIIILDQAMLYKFLGSFNTVTMSSDALYHNFAAYSYGVSRNGSLEIYVLGDVPANAPSSHTTIEYLRYLFTDHRNIYVVGRNVSCSSPFDGTKLLLAQYNPGTPYNGTLVDAWLDSGGCSATLIHNYTPMGYLDARLYSISG